MTAVCFCHSWMSWLLVTPVESCWCTRTMTASPGSQGHAWAWWVQTPEVVRTSMHRWPRMCVLVFQLTCVAVGDVCNKGKVSLVCTSGRKTWATSWGLRDGVFPLCQNFVVAVGAEGWFHLFDLTAATASKSESSSQHELTSFDDQKPLFTQHIPANTKVILISDIGKSAVFVGFLGLFMMDSTTDHSQSTDGDGRCELVVGYTDRVVRAFRWEEPTDGSDPGIGQLILLKKWLLEGQVGPYLITDYAIKRKDAKQKAAYFFLTWMGGA